MGLGRLFDADVSLGLRSPYTSLAGARPGRVTHCCFEHAGQNFGSLDRGPRAAPLWTCMESMGGQSAMRGETKRQRTEAGRDSRRRSRTGDREGCAVDVAKASGQGVRAPRAPTGGVSKVWDVAATTGAVTELAEQLVELAIEKVTVESTSDYWRIWYYLLEAAGLRRAAGQRPRREERARPAQNRQARRGVAGQAHREGAAAALVRAAGTDPAAARLHPAAGRSDPGTHPLLAAAGEAARGRVDQGVDRGVAPWTRCRCGT